MLAHQNNGIQRRFILSIFITTLILVAEVAGSLWTGSLALLSDAAHVFMDIFALALSFVALRLSAMPPDDSHSFGFHRLEVLAALVNGVSLAVIALGIGWEAIQRWQVPQPVKSIEMLVIAFIGLVVNLVVALILGGHEQTSDKRPIQRDLNVRSAFLHVIGDAVSSLGVILAAIVISLTGWMWVDPLASLLIAGMITFSAVRITRSALHILIEGVPEGMSVKNVAEVIQQIPGISDVHDLHIWNLCSKHVSLSAHLTFTSDGEQSSEVTLAAVRQRLNQDFGIDHTTLQVERIHCDQALADCGGNTISLPTL